MKNKGIIITLIVLLSIIIILLTIFLVAVLNGKTNFNIGIISIGSKSNNVIFDKTFKTEDINKIEINQDAGEIIFKEATNNNIQVVIYGDESEDVDVNLDNNILNIDYTKTQNLISFNFGTPKNDIIVYIPADYQNEIKLKNDYGVCEMTDLANARVDIDCSAGDVKLGKIKDATIKCDYGNVEVEEILNKCNITADCGNIEISKISIQENSTVKADLGNVEINETNDIYIDASCDLGEVKINNNNRNSETELTITCDCGNIIVDN